MIFSYLEKNSFRNISKLSQVKLFQEIFITLEKYFKRKIIAYASH
jgi:hypothetical protein